MARELYLEPAGSAAMAKKEGGKKRRKRERREKSERGWANLLGERKLFFDRLFHNFSSFYVLISQKSKKKKKEKYLIIFIKLILWTKDIPRNFAFEGEEDRGRERKTIEIHEREREKGKKGKRDITRIKERKT